ncbi:MAG: hypothetical protein LBC68_14565 [Prevotellaceae bacterium]|nr:hypothetical protein [Prevotellaceae bacterium]
MEMLLYIKISRGAATVFQVNEVNPREICVVCLCPRAALRLYGANDILPYETACY